MDTYDMTHDIDPTFLPFLDEAVRRTGVEHYRFLCTEHPDEKVRSDYQRLVIALAAQTEAASPSVATMAGNALGAIGRAGVAVLSGKRVQCTSEEMATRWSECVVCENWVNDKCRICGCRLSAKIALRTERCPIDKWKRIES
jgi:hypothetical protein